MCRRAFVDLLTIVTLCDLTLTLTYNIILAYNATFAYVGHQSYIWEHFVLKEFQSKALDGKYGLSTKIPRFLPLTCCDLTCDLIRIFLVCFRCVSLRAFYCRLARLAAVIGSEDNEGGVFGLMRSAGALLYADSFALRPLGGRHGLLHQRRRQGVANPGYFSSMPQVSPLSSATWP